MGVCKDMASGCVELVNDGSDDSGGADDPCISSTEADSNGILMPF